MADLEARTTIEAREIEGVRYFRRALMGWFM